MPFASDAFRGLFGLTLFDTQKGHGSFVTSSLTRTPTDPREHAFLWVKMCTWRIRVGGEEIAHSESPDDVIATAAARLNGRRLEALVLHEVVSSDGTIHAATLYFSDRALLRMEQYDDSEPGDAIFSVRVGDDQWVSYDSDGNTRDSANKA